MIGLVINSATGHRHLHHPEQDQGSAHLKGLQPPSTHLFSYLPSGKRLQSISARSSRLKDSFYPQAIRLLNNST